MENYVGFPIIIRRSVIASRRGCHRWPSSFIFCIPLPPLPPPPQRRHPLWRFAVAELWHQQDEGERGEPAQRWPTMQRVSMELYSIVWTTHSPILVHYTSSYHRATVTSVLHRFSSSPNNVRLHWPQEIIRSSGHGKKKRIFITSSQQRTKVKSMEQSGAILDKLHCTDDG